MESTYKGIKFTDADIVNPDDFIPASDADGSRAYNPHNVRPWLLHDHGYCVCVVFASSVQDALDEAVNCDKLDQFKVDDGDLDALDYKDDKGDTDGITYLGNASEPFDIESLDIIELPNPKFSFCAMFNAMQESK